jgi:GDPmannose 4,6-dehydratase
VRPGRGGLGASEHLREQLTAAEVDLLDPQGLREAVRRHAPDEIYHLAAPSFVPDSWRRPAETVSAILGSTAALLEEVRDGGAHARLFVAGSGTMFGDARESPQREDTPARPLNPYSVAKHGVRELAAVFREEQGVFCSCGIAYNHESERRPEQFVTRRVSRGVAAIALGRAERLTLGDLQAVRDWSFAGDVMRGAWLSLQHSEPMDFVLASGVGHTVEDLVRSAFAHAGLEVDGRVAVDETLRRAPETTSLVGDPSRAREVLGWRAELGFEALVARMVDFDLRDLREPPGDDGGS